MIQDLNKIAIINGEREITYNQLIENVTYFSHQASIKRGDMCMIFSENREGWIYAFLSVWMSRGIAVPVDASSTVEDVAYILNDCKPQLVWTSSSHEAIVREAMQQLGMNITINIIDQHEACDNASTISTDKYFFQKLMANERRQETAVLIYTSGTTGSPKGVMLSYANLYSNMAGVVDEVPIFNGHRRTIILLPLHHILPLMGTLVIPLLTGDGVAICPSLSGPDIMQTLCRGKVGIMIGVPRLWQTLYNGIKKKIDESAITRGLFRLCAAVGSPALSRFIFQSVHKKMGGHLMYCVSGGAALDREVALGLKTLGIRLLEGYGMSETSPIIAFTRPDDIIPGCVGRPLPSVECKLVNGELCAKGPNVMQGYYNRPEETAAVIDADGFIHTGDLAEIDEKGRVTITGRIKEIIVLSNGKNVQPTEIEFKLERYTSLIKEVAVTEQNDKLVAIIVPQPAWAEGRSVADMEQLIKKEVIEPYNLTVENYKKIMRICITDKDLPRTKLEKLQRFKLKGFLKDMGAPASADKPQKEENTSETYKIIKQYLQQEKHLPVNENSHLETDLAMDSLDRVSLQGFIESTFGMKLDLDQMMQYPTVGQLAQLVLEGKTKTSIEGVNWSQLLHQSSSNLTLPVSSWIHPLGSSISRLFFTMYNRLEIKGKENIPSSGPFIIAPNHQSFIDGPLVSACLDRQTLRNSYAYATEEHVRGRLARSYAHNNNIILMERHDLKNSIMRMAEVLKQGKNLIIFPEGRRCDDGRVGEFKKTFAILSKELQVPIVPISIKGAYDALSRKDRFLKPCKLEMEIMPPITPMADESYEALSARVRESIIASQEK